MIYEIKRVNVWSVAKVSFVLGGVLGVAAGIFLWMFAGMLSQFPMSDLGDTESLEGLGSLGAMMPFFMGICYAFMLMIANGLLAGAYNLMVGIVGGIELALVVPPADTQAQAWSAPPPPPPPSAVSGWPQTPPQTPPPAPPAVPGS